MFAFGCVKKNAVHFFDAFEKYLFFLIDMLPVTNNDVDAAATMRVGGGGGVVLTASALTYS